jgi:hypothetical protein
MPRALEEVDQVDWASLRGAYGSCEQVADMLRALVSDDEDTFRSAIDDGLHAHVWHQGDVFEVTAHVVPFVVGVVNDRAARDRASVAHTLCLFAEAAVQLAASGDVGARANAAAVRRALESELPSIRQWWTDEDAGVADVGVVLAWRLGAPRHDLFAHVAKLARAPRATELLAVAVSDDIRDEAWAVDLATRVAADTGALPAARVAAALLLQLSRARFPRELDRVIDELTSPQARAALPWGFDVPPFAFPRRAEAASIDAEVVFSGANLFVARAEDGRQFTVRWPASGLTKGDRVRIREVSTGGVPLLVEARPGDAGASTMRFDARGESIG